MAKYINPYTDFGFKKLFGEEAEVANFTPAQRDEYEQSRLSYLEVKEAVNTAELDGMKKKAIEIARDMKIEGFDTSTIKRLTGLSDEDIARF